MSPDSLARMDFAELAVVIQVRWYSVKSSFPSGVMVRTACLFGNARSRVTSGRWFGKNSVCPGARRDSEQQARFLRV